MPGGGRPIGRIPRRPTADGRPALAYSVAARDARERLEAWARSLRRAPGLRGREAKRRDEHVFDAHGARGDREALLGRTAYGVLNGGSATSYADSKKNLAFGQGVFDALAPSYKRLAPLCKDRPKGLTPAYLEPDGSPGASFLLLKMRARLVAALRARSGARRSMTPSCLSSR